MRKKIILMAATFLLAVAAYFVFSIGDRRVQAPARDDSSEAVNRFVTRPTTQASQSISDAEMTFSPGDQTLVRVYDEITGRLKYVFEADSWEPTSETDFHLRNLAIQIHMPRGEISYIRADEAEVTLSRKAKNRVDPKRGRLWGHVTVTIDRSTAQWRADNPELADLYAHPDDLIHIDLGDARFDMDRAELVAEGAVLVDSREARIEGVRGLTVQWDQVDNRIDVLRFEHGGQMALRRGGKMVDFAMPGTTRGTKRPSSPASPVAGLAQAAMQVPRAQAMKPMSIGAITAEEAAAEIRLEGGVVSANQPRSLGGAGTSNLGSTSTLGQLRSPEALTAAVASMQAEARRGTGGEAVTDGLLVSAEDKSKGRVHTYRAVFNHRVVVEQKEGLLTKGMMEAEKLEINFDFGRRQRDMASKSPKAQGAATTLEPTEPDAPAQKSPPTASLFETQDETKLILTWDGPMELRPIRVESDEQTGQRFDAVAIGDPVRLKSDQGTASCDQLVYRHERRQVWLSGNPERPVVMAVDDSRRLTGREVFFDQRRGLGRVEGSGTMADDRRAGEQTPSADATLFKVADGLAAGRGGRDQGGREPVEIGWERGVDLEVGARSVEVINPATGLMEEQTKEYLRRAWFHGDVSIRQGDESLVGEEIAVTFGVPRTQDDLADHIRHLNMSGRVRLVRGDDELAGQRLDVEMTLTPDGRNVPSIVDAEGSVLARQSQREIRAGKMHVELAMVPSGVGRGARSDKSQIGIDKIDASGNVLIHDPEQNLKVSRAESLKVTMRGGNQLARATILSSEPATFARARFGDVAIHGHRIEIDMDKPSVDVPGPGVTHMRTQEDFGGRKLSATTIVRTTWRDRMEFQLGRDYGVFMGEVDSRSDRFQLKSDKLTVRFRNAPLPPPKRKSKGVSPVQLFQDAREEAAWVGIVGSPSTVVLYTSVRLLTGLPREMVLGRAGSALAGRNSGRDVRYDLPGGDRKRPVSIVAEGHAEAVSSEYAPKTALGLRGRLLNRMRIAADQIVADLAAEQMSVPCEGTLLIEDYQFDPKAIRSQSIASSEATSPMMSSLRSDGPSQTMVAWANSMDYFVDRNLVVFDKNVSMIHRSGQAMVLRDELATAMQLDAASMRHISEGRRASLSCGNLLLEFERAAAEPAAETASPVRATDLRRLIAKSAVHFQENTRSLMGEHLQFLKEVGEIRLEGGPALEARIIDQDERNQRFSMWKGPILIWDRLNDRIEAPQATIRTSQR